MKWIVIVFFIYTHSVLAGLVFRTGNPTDVTTENNFLACLAGGGDDDGWGRGWKSLLESTNHGDVVIIRADDERGGYEDWIFNDTSSLNFPKVNSVTTIVLNSKNDGNDPKIIDLIKKAELVFFAGGDQSDYIDLLKGTAVEALIQARVDQFNLSIAGTSAGMAIMGEFEFGAHYPSPRDEESNVNALDVLLNPMGIFVDIQKSIIRLPFLNKTITDTHFSQREREGRLLGFIAKTMLIENDFINGIGADEETALCYNQNGMGQVFGIGNVYVIIPETYPQLDVDQSLLFKASKVLRLKNNDKFDFNLWNSLDAQIEYWKIEKINNQPQLIKF